MNTEDLYAVGIRLWNEWTEMWNGKPDLARTIVAPKFALHLVQATPPMPNPLDPSTIDSPAAVEAWVKAHRAKFTRLTFSTGVGPFVDVTKGIVAGPWIADTAIAGAPRPVCGMDTIAFRDGKITEYWTLSKEADAFGEWGVRRT